MIRPKVGNVNRHFPVIGVGRHVDTRHRSHKLRTSREPGRLDILSPYQFAHSRRLLRVCNSLACGQGMGGVASRATLAPLTELHTGFVAEARTAGITGDSVKSGLVNQNAIVARGGLRKHTGKRSLKKSVLCKLHTIEGYIVKHTLCGKLQSRESGRSVQRRRATLCHPLGLDSPD